MKRDGACTSLWQMHIPDFTERNYDASELFDTVIIGGGITGVTTALLLQKAGRKCLLLEAHNLCFGTTGGTTSHLNTFFDTDYHQIQKDFGEEGAQLVATATKQALDLFKQHVAEYNIDCGYEEKDGYVYSQTAEQTEQLQKIYEASKVARTEVEYANEIPVPIPFQKAIVYRRQAQLHPTKYVLALAKAFEAAGGIIIQQCKVNDVKKRDDDLLDVETTKGTFNVQHVIWCTHIPPGINLLHFRCAPYRSYAMAVKLKGGNYPNGLAYDMYDPYHYYRTQDIDGEKYLIVGGEDHKTAHEENTEMCFTHLESHIKKFFNVEQVVARWSSQYFEPSDGLAYIGHLPGNPDHVYVATGFSGNGITYSHIAAITLRDLILTGKSDYADLFSPSRIKPVAGFAAFVKENADVVKEFVAKRIAKEHLTDLAELSAGEAKVVTYEGESIALYKDEGGALHAVNPVCTHAKCIVAWNRAERTWDCPCHGARYSPDGEVLTGPASKGLEKVELTDLTVKDQ